MIARLIPRTYTHVKSCEACSDEANSTWATWVVRTAL